MGGSKKKKRSKKPKAKAKKFTPKAALKRKSTPKKKAVTKKVPKKKRLTVKKAAAPKKKATAPKPAKATKALIPPVKKSLPMKPIAKAPPKTEPKKPDPKAKIPAKPLSKPEAKKADPKSKTVPKPEAKAPETIVPDPSVKRPPRPFFMEVKPGSERVIKRGDKSLATPAPLDIQARRKGTTAEETPEELVERIERELEHQFFAKRNSKRAQLCTKCGLNPVTARFTIDRELGYCDGCAEILRLGETKEARRMEFNTAVAKTGGEAKPAAEGEAEEEESGTPAVPDPE